MPGTVIAAVEDLFFLVQVKEAAARAGLRFEITNKSPEEILSAARKDAAGTLLVIDLNARALTPLEVIRTLKSDPATSSARIFGFVPHVQTDLRKEAQEAGADLVSAKSAFGPNLQKFLARDN